MLAGSSERRRVSGSDIAALRIDNHSVWLPSGGATPIQQHSGYKGKLHVSDRQPRCYILHDLQLERSRQDLTSTALGIRVEPSRVPGGKGGSVLGCTRQKINT